MRIRKPKFRVILTNFVSCMSFSLQQIIGSASPSSPIQTLDVIGENDKMDFFSSKLEKIVRIVINNGQNLTVLLVASYIAMKKVSSMAQHISKRLLCTSMSSIHSP